MASDTDSLDRRPHRVGPGRVPTFGFWLGVLLASSLLLVPESSGLSAPARRTAAVAALMAAWWITEAVPIAATALVPLILLPIFGVLPGGRVAGAYANSYVFLFLGGFLLALAMERWDLHRRLALALLGRAGTKPDRVVGAFMLAAAALSMWVSNTATVLLMLPIARAVVERMCAAVAEPRRETAERSLGVTLMIGLAYGASIGGMGTLIGTPPNIVLAGAMTELFPAAPRIGFLQWMGLGVPLTLVLLPGAWWIVRRFAPPVPLSAFDFGDAGRSVREERARLGPWGRGERMVMAVFLATVSLWLTRSPGWGAWVPHGDGIDDATVVLGTTLLFFLLRAPARGAGPGVPHIPLLEWRTVERGVPWGVLLLFGGGFALAAAFQQSGLAGWIGDRLASAAGFPLPVLVLAVALGVTFLTELTSNTATATLLMPVLASTAVAIGVNPLLLLMPAALSASCAFMLPVATPPNAIIFGTPWVTVPRLARTGLAMNLFGAAIITLFTLGPLRLVFGVIDLGLPGWAVSRFPGP